MTTRPYAGRGDRGDAHWPMGPGPVTMRLVGQELAGRYVVGEVLGGGGMARVYAGFDRLLGQPCALKVARAEKHFPRLEREAHLGSQLALDGLARVYDLALLPDGKTPFAAFERLEGETLGERLRRAGPLLVIDALRVARAVAAVAACLHERGALHRDIKPDNIFLCASGAVKLIDLGLARIDGDAALTTTGVGVGTPGYMPPEQRYALPDIDGRADVYALGATLYQMIAGIEANADIVFFSGSSTSDERPPVTRWDDLRQRRAGVPERVARIVMRAVEYDRARRWESMQRFHQAMDACVVALEAGEPDLAPEVGEPDVAPEVGEPDVAPEAAPMIAPPKSRRVDKRRRSWCAAIGISILVVLGGVVMAMVWMRRGGEVRREVPAARTPAVGGAEAPPSEEPGSPARPGGRTRGLGFEEWNR